MDTGTLGAILNNLPALLAGLGLPGRLSLLTAAVLGIILGSPFDADT